MLSVLSWIWPCHCGLKTDFRYLTTFIDYIANGVRRLCETGHRSAIVWLHNQFVTLWEWISVLKMGSLPLPHSIWGHVDMDVTKMGNWKTPPLKDTLFEYAVKFDFIWWSQPNVSSTFTYEHEHWCIRYIVVYSNDNWAYDIHVWDIFYWQIITGIGALVINQIYFRRGIWLLIHTITLTNV